MKKKFAGILMSFCLLCMGLLAGCSLVEPNYKNYYNQVVAVVENKTTKEKSQITKRDLITAYQSYGYTYEQYYGYTREEAVKYSLELLENRKITIMTAESEFGINKKGDGLSDKEKTYLWQEVVDSLNENLDIYYDNVIGATDEEEENSDITFEGYEKNATIEEQDGRYVIKKTNTEEDLLANFHPTVNRDFYKEEDHNLIYENFRDNVINSNDDYKKAFDNYFKELKAMEYGMGLSTDAPSVFNREIDRLYNVAYENYVLEKYSYSNKNLDSLSSITPAQIVNLYTSKVKASYTQYVLEEDSAYDTNVQESLNDVYYFKNDDSSTKFFTVANVLFKFTDEQQAQHDAIVAKMEKDDGGYYHEQYEQELDKLYSQITPVLRQYNEGTGIYEEVEDTNNLTVEDAYNKMVITLASAQAEGVNKVGDTINEFIYAYGEDTGMFNAESNYVVGIDSEGNAVSSFVESFNDAAIELYNNGNGQIGDISGLVRSEYGIHVLFYTGPCVNLFDGIDSSFTLNENAIETLYNTRVNILVDKTYFDVLYDEIYADNYAYFENANMNFLRENYNIKEYGGRFDDLYE